MIEIVFDRSYYQGCDFGALPEGHLRLRWPNSGARDLKGLDPWIVLQDAMPGHLGELAAKRELAYSGSTSAEQILNAARRLAEVIGEFVGSGSIQRHSDGLTADLRLATADSAIAAGALRLAVIAANGAANAANDISNSESLKSEFLTEAVTKLTKVAATRQGDATTTAIIAAADERRIPHIRFDRWPFIDDDEECPNAKRGLLQLGEGCHQHQLRGVLSSSVPRATIALLADHWATWLHLKTTGLPVAERDPESQNIVMASRARRAARRLGYPLVVKSRTRGRGVGVTVGIADEQALGRAVRAAQRVSRQVIVERQVLGENVRLLVIGREVAGFRLGPLGATNDVEDLHPELRKLAVRALTGLDLKIAEVDMIVQDISAEPMAENVAVLGIDPAPDLGQYRLPGEAAPMAMSRLLLGELFPPETPTTIPKVAITGTNGKTTTAHIVANILQQAGHTVGLASTNGCFINGQPVLLHEASHVSGALELLLKKEVTAAVLETARGGLAHTGLAFHDTTVAACTNIANDHIGLEGINSLDQMAEHKRQVVETALECAVLNGSDERCLAMRPHLRARRQCLFSLEADNEAIRKHILEGGIAANVVDREGHPTLALQSKEGDIPLLRVTEMPLSWGGRAKHNIENALCATGLAYGMGVAPKVIAKALRELDTTAELIPGRLNRISGLPYELIVDAAHNAHGMRALAKFVESIPRSGGRRIFALVARESDSEEALDAMVNEAAEVFDIFVCRDVSKLYRLEPGQCANALAAALRRTGVEEDRIKVIPERLEAMRYALDIAKPSDLVVIELAHLVVLRDLIDEIETRKRELRSAG